VSAQVLEEALTVITERRDPLFLENEKRVELFHFEFGVFYDT
jgi:hypothetical protein